MSDTPTPTPYTSDFHSVPMLEWRCNLCVITLSFKQDMGQRQWIVDDLIKTHLESHQKPADG